MNIQKTDDFNIIKKHKTVAQNVQILQMYQPIAFLLKVINDSENDSQYANKQIKSLFDEKNASKHQVIIGHKTLQKSLENIILQMKVGQIWEVKGINSQSKNQNHFLIEILESKQSVGQKKSNFELAKQLKDAGNGFIKNKQNLKAKQKYIQAFKLIQFNSSNEAEQLKLSLINNLSLCCNNLSLFVQAINWCNRHLNQTQQPNTKIIYRKAVAQKGLKEWKNAKVTIQDALKRWKDNQTQINFNELLQNLKKQENQNIKKQKAVYSKMFS